MALQYFVVHHDGEPTAMARIRDRERVERVIRGSDDWEEYPELISLIWRPDSDINWDEISPAEAEHFFTVLTGKTTRLTR